MQKTLSDFNGYDPMVHNNNASKVLSELHGAFLVASGSTTLNRMKLILAAVNSGLPTLKTKRGKLLGPGGFRGLTVLAREAALIVPP